MVYSCFSHIQIVYHLQFFLYVTHLSVEHCKCRGELTGTVTDDTKHSPHTCHTLSQCWQLLHYWWNDWKSERRERKRWEKGLKTLGKHLASVKWKASSSSNSCISDPMREWLLASETHAVSCTTSSKQILQLLLGHLSTHSILSYFVFVGETFCVPQISINTVSL